MALGDIILEYTNGKYYSSIFEFFDNGTKIAMNDDDDVVVWDLEKDEIITRVAHTNNVYDLKVSNDESMVVSSGYDNIKVWDIDSGAIIKTFTSHSNYVSQLTISNDDTKVISASGTEIYVWEIATKNILVTFTDHSTSMYTIDISPDGTWIASEGFYKTIQIWDITTGNIIYTIDVPEQYIKSLDFHPDGDKILAATNDQTVKLYEISTGEVLNEFTQHTDKINDCKLLPDGRRAVSCGDDEQIFIWEVESNTVLLNSDISNSVEGVGSGPNGSKIALGYSYDAAIIELIDQSGLVLMNNYGQIYNNDPDYLPVPIDIGRILITEVSEIYEVIFKNSGQLAVKNITITTNNEKLGTDLIFSKTQSPFDGLQSLTFTGTYNPGDTEIFYIKLNTDLQAAKGENSLLINVDAEFAY